MLGVRAVIDNIICEYGHNQKDQGSSQYRQQDELWANRSLYPDQGGGSSWWMSRVCQVHHKNSQSNPDSY